MTDQTRFVRLSLELHLFFARTMKEHALFLKAGFTPVDETFARQAEFYKRGFEAVLCQAARLSSGVVGKRVLDSGEILTEFTAGAERRTQSLTGIRIDRQITRMEARLRCGEPNRVSPELYRRVRELNRTALHLLDGLIAFKEDILRRVLRCSMFTANYPLLIEHITREAKL